MVRGYLVRGFPSRDENPKPTVAGTISSAGWPLAWGLLALARAKSLRLDEAPQPLESTKQGGTWRFNHDKWCENAVKLGFNHEILWIVWI